MEPNKIRTVSNYELDMSKPIGQGAYGAIYLAKDTKNPQEMLVCK